VEEEDTKKITTAMMIILELKHAMCIIHDHAKNESSYYCVQPATHQKNAMQCNNNDKCKGASRFLQSNCVYTMTTICSI
jgi:hypothetical protein